MFAQLHARSIPGLDGVRAIAVGLVMFYHFGYLRVPGGHGVLIFFVLSGFLITWLMLAERERTGTVSLRAFYFRRATRILPAFYAYVAFVLVLLVLTKRRILWDQVAACGLYVANYYNALIPEHERMGILSHLWSLAIEEQFYLLWPATFLALGKRSARVAAVLAAAIAGIWIYRGVVAYSVGDMLYVYHAFDTRADALLAGCLTAVVIRGGMLRPFWRAVTASRWAPLLTVGTFAILTQLPVSSRVAWAFKAPVETLLAAVAIVQLAVLSDAGPWSWLNHPAVRWMGRLSYSLYLYQLGLSPYVLPGRSEPVRLVGCFALTFGLAALSYYVVERPFLRWKSRSTLTVGQGSGGDRARPEPVPALETYGREAASE